MYLQAYMPNQFIKPTNPQLFLHYNSNHPRQVFKAIVYGQAITVKTICSKVDFVVKPFNNLGTKFTERGYQVELVEENLNREGALSRADLLKPKPAYPRDAAPPTQNKRKFKPIFIITYNPHNPDLKGWLREVYFIFQADKKMRKIFPCPPQLSTDSHAA